MGLKPLALPLESNPGRFRQDGDPRLINVYAEKRGEKDRAGKQPVAHYAVPGLVEWTDVPNGGAGRGMFAVDNASMIVVSGQAVVRCDPFGSTTFLGGMLGSKPLTFARNLKSPTPQVVIVGDNQSKVWEGGSTIVDIADPDLQPANSVDFISRYVLFGHSNGRFSYSAIDDATSIAALDYYTAEGKPDGLVRLKVVGDQIWLLGEETVEVWAMTDSLDDPFARIDATYINLGCRACNSVVQIGQRLAWIADDFTVRLAQGYDAEIISTHAVSAAIESVSDPSTIEASLTTIRGHQMLRINAPDWTWVCNVTPGYGLWHEERSIGSTRRRAAHYARFAGKHLTLDSASAKIWSMDADTGVDGDTPLICRIVTAPVHVFPGEIEFNALHVDGIAGSGLNTPSDPVTLDPVILERDSDDGGETWSNELRLEIGRQGSTRTRAVAHQLGTAPEEGRIFELTWDAAANRCITGAVVDAVAIA